MGRKYNWQRQCFYICSACLISLLFFGCITLKENSNRLIAEGYLLNSQKLLAAGDYKGALEENFKVLSVNGKDIPGDEALFNIGLIYAHYGNPGKDYKKSLAYFEQLIREYPQSPLLEQAKIMTGILNVIEKAKQVDLEIEKKKKELAR